MKRYFVLGLFFLPLFVSIGSAQTDPEGSQDYYVVGDPIYLGGDSYAVEITFHSDNTGSNRVAAFGLPIFVSFSDTSLFELDTSIASIFAGSMVADFHILLTSTDSCCGGNADPTLSPVHFVMGAVNLQGGITGDGLFATLRFKLHPIWINIFCIDTLSTSTLKPSLVTESGVEYTPGWQVSPYYYCPELGVVKDISAEANLPAGFSLEQNFPNPFNAKTIIRFEVARVSRVRLEVFDVLGRKVMTLVDETLFPGYKQVLWDGKDQNGQEVASGVYFYRLSAEGFQVTKKLVLLR
jgi:hypothetical protein